MNRASIRWVPKTSWQHPKALKHQGTQKEKLVLQTMQMAAHETINEARTKFKDAVQTLQQSVQQSAQKAPTDLGEMQATFEQACRNAATAITGEAQGAVVQAWQQHRARHKALDKLDKNFTLDMVKGGITIAASAGAAAAHAAALPLSIASIVKTVGMMGLQIKDYVADSDAAARDVISADKTLGRAATSDTRTALKIGARELAGAVGVPIDSVNGMEQQLEIFRAKSQRTERTAKRLHHAANQMMRKLEKLEVQAGSDPKKQQAVEQMRTQVSGLLDKVSTLMERVKSDETFYEVHKSRCKAYREGLGSKLKGTVRNIDSAQVVMDMAATAKSMAEVSRMVVGAFT